MQLNSMCIVRTQASASYRELMKEKGKMIVLLRSLNTTHNKELELSTPGTDDSSRGQKNQQSPSLVETTISRYSYGVTNNGDTSNFSRTGSSHIETRTHPDIGLQYSYNKSWNFIS